MTTPPHRTRFGLPASCTLCLLVACGAGPTTVSAPTTAGSSAAPLPAWAGTEPASSTGPAPSRPPAEAVHRDPASLDPALATAQAPALFRALFRTTKGDFVIEVHRDWAPNGADRFYNLVKLGFFDDTRFFRAIDGFMVQFGIHGDPTVSRKWRGANIHDDAVTQSNKRGFVTFAQTSAADSRSTQVFVNSTDNVRLDQSRFAPFGQVIEGMNVVDSLYHGYGEGSPGGSGPDQSRIQENGNSYLDQDFPKLDRILSTELQ
jgi:peptidyl-prolyl cis-trans isomerase A (cyclophilin A)